VVAVEVVAVVLDEGVDLSFELTRECQKFCVEGHTASLMAGGLYGGPEGIDRGVVGEPEP
jgi:hypothetical protein